MVKDVTKFHKCQLWGRGVQGFIQDFDFWEGGTPKFGVDVEGVYSTTTSGVWGHAPPDF